ncbi:SGNH/GDSL hydrolase family protein [Tichowtungia aerotolerans]|uniref:SGNH/GDSL hydrolase family protein n=1 Tax=Tichowtungia aerotolerans TaxID=2697043 RepID=A0A6P1MCU9_9BACT|nr:SGNH/GDSL hydrolase family protein [Tichowtungia aerotolerans]QHI69426.1 SGNH/GDSL hydrolase family protein [Tichowtungia aerotolerans]
MDLSKQVIVSWLALIGIAVAGNSSFYTPEEDLGGLTYHRAANDQLPNVLIIGDSISIGYTTPVIEKLAGIANVERIPVNGGDTASGLRRINHWVGQKKWDVIHFNFGLHDLCYRHPDSPNHGHRDKINGTIAVPLDQYEKNLEQLVARLEATGAALVWASTTVVPDGELGRIAGDEIRYNQVAARVMKKHHIAMDDLHAVTASFGPELFRAFGDVHYVKAGYEELAGQVAESIKKALGEKVKQGSNHE